MTTSAPTSVARTVPIATSRSTTRRFDDTGTSLEIGAMDLAAYSNDQVNRIFQDVSPVNGYVDVWSDTAGARSTATAP